MKAGKEIVRPERAEKLSSSPTVQELIDAYINHRRKTGTEQTLIWYMGFLKPFGLEFGALKASALKSSAVTNWIAGRTSWGDNMRYGCGRAVMAVFNFAMREKTITENPLAEFRKGRPVPRDGAEFDNVEWAKLREAVRGMDFEDCLVFMRLTGCRPLEVRSIEARHFVNNVILFPRQESKGKINERVIQLAGESLAIIQRLAALHPTGPIICDSEGRAWNQSAFSRRCRKLIKLTGVKQLLPYSCRHSFCTQCIVLGMDSLIVAKLMGHVDIKQVVRVYAKVMAQGEFMRDQALRATAGL